VGSVVIGELFAGFVVLGRGLLDQRVLDRGLQRVLERVLVVPSLASENSKPIPS
jgi:hypothetical protein